MIIEAIFKWKVKGLCKIRIFSKVNYQNNNIMDWRQMKIFYLKKWNTRGLKMNLLKALTSWINLRIIRVKMRYKKNFNSIKIYRFRLKKMMSHNNILRNKISIKMLIQTFNHKKYFSKDFLLSNLNQEKATKWRIKFWKYKKKYSFYVQFCQLNKICTW